MRRYLLSSLLLMLIGSTNLFAADFWDNHEFMEWDEKQVRKLLSDSPWAQEYAIADPSAGRTSMAAGVGASGGSMGRGRVPLQIFTIMWRSSSPIKRALVRLMSPGEVSLQAQEYLDSQETSYVVSIAAAHEVFGPVTKDEEALRSFMSLEIKGQPARKPDAVELQENPSGLSINYHFSRANEIILANKEVAVIFQMERQVPDDADDNAKQPKALNIKRKFKLKDMVFSGKLDL